MDSLYCREARDVIDRNHVYGIRYEEHHRHVSGDGRMLESPSSTPATPVMSSRAAEHLMPPPSSHHHHSHAHNHGGLEVQLVQNHLPSFSVMEAAARKHVDLRGEGHVMEQSSPTSNRPNSTGLVLNLITYPSQHHPLTQHYEQQFIDGGPDRVRFSSGGSSDSCSSVRMPVNGSVRCVSVIQPGYEGDHIQMQDRPPSEISLSSTGPVHYITMTPEATTPTSVEYHPNHHVLSEPRHQADEIQSHHYAEQDHYHQHMLEHSFALHDQKPEHLGHTLYNHHRYDDQFVQEEKPSIDIHDPHPSSSHLHLLDSVGNGATAGSDGSHDPKRVKREQARNYVKQKRLEIQQNDPVKYEQLKEKNRIRRREKLKEIREDPIRYEEMKRKQRERVKEQRERIKQNPAAYEEMKRKQREREKARRREIMSDPATAAAWRERHRIMARERRLKRKFFYHVQDVSRQVGCSPDVKYETDPESDVHVQPPAHLHQRMAIGHEAEHIHGFDQHREMAMEASPAHICPPPHYRIHSDEPEVPFVEERRPPSSVVPEHPDPYPEHHRVQHVEQPDAQQQTGMNITPHQALTALIQSSEPIQEQINKYFAELKKSSEKRSDLILQLGLKKRADSNKKKRSAGRGRKGAKEERGFSRDSSSAFSPSLSSSEDGPSCKSTDVDHLCLKRDDDFGRVGSSNDDSQESADELNSVQAGSIVVHQVHPHDHPVSAPDAGVTSVETSGYGVMHVSSTSGIVATPSGMRPPSSEMFFMGIASPPPSPGVEMGAQPHLGIHIPRSGHHVGDGHGGHLQMSIHQDSMVGQPNLVRVPAHSHPHSHHHAIPYVHNTEPAYGPEIVADHMTEEGLLGRRNEFSEHEQGQTQAHHVFNLVDSASPQRAAPTSTSVSPETVAIDCSSQRLSSASSGYGSQRGSDYGLPHGEDHTAECGQVEDEHTRSPVRETSAVDMSYLSRI